MYKFLILVLAFGVTEGIEYEETHHAGYQVEPHYSYEYAVQDPKTGHIHSKKEERKGDSIQGEYSLVEADGSKRRVQYTFYGKSGHSGQVGHGESSYHSSGQRGSYFRQGSSYESSSSSFHSDPSSSSGYGSGSSSGFQSGLSSSRDYVSGPSSSSSYESGSSSSSAYQPGSSSSSGYQPGPSSFSGHEPGLASFQVFRPALVTYQPIRRPATIPGYRPEYRALPVNPPQQYNPGAPSYSYLAATPSYRPAPPNYLAAAPGYKPVSPSYQAAAPSYQPPVPIYKAPTPSYQSGYGQGGATSVVSFSTHGAHVLTSTNHIIPAKPNY